MCCVSVLCWNGTLVWWNQGRLICKADRAVLWCSVHREAKGAAQHDSKHLSAKIRTNEIQYTWLEGKERSVTDGRHEWKQAKQALLYGYQRMSRPNRFVLSPGPLLIPDKGNSVRHRDSVCVRFPGGNDTEYKCMGSASDGPAHVEVGICIAEEGCQESSLREPVSGWLLAVKASVSCPAEYQDAAYSWASTSKIKHVDTFNISLPR